MALFQPVMDYNPYSTFTQGLPFLSYDGNPMAFSGVPGGFPGWGGGGNVGTSFIPASANGQGMFTPLINTILQLGNLMGAPGLAGLTPQGLAAGQGLLTPYQNTGTPWDQTQYYQLPNGGNAFQRQFFIPNTPQPTYQAAEVWGDPHFVGFEGDKYDVQGQAGKTYNILSDKGFQYNAKFVKYNGKEGKDGATVIGEAGITVGNARINYKPGGETPTVNGQALEKGKTYNLGNNSSVTWNGDSLNVKSPEYEVDLKDQGDHLDQKVKIGKNGVAMDGVMPHGLLGQTADGDGKARKGDEGAGAQGGGAIEGANGIAKKGDKDAVKLYEVGDVFDTSFGSKFNRFYGPINTQPGFVAAGQGGQAF